MECQLGSEGLSGEDFFFNFIYFYLEGKVKKTEISAGSLSLKSTTGRALNLGFLHDPLLNHHCHQMGFAP